jgi:hypothetical protein
MSDFVEKNLFLTHFLPPRTSNRPFRAAWPANPAPTVWPPLPNPAPRDRESDPAVQRARDLGRYGSDLIRLIEKDYAAAIKDWRDAFENILTAFGTAVGVRDETIRLAEQEQQRDAAIGGAILSLLTAGTMKLLSVYVEHIAVPSIKASGAAFKGVGALRGSGLPTDPRRFTGAQAAAFGGLAEEAGKAALDQALKPGADMPSPRAKRHRLDTPHGVNDLRRDFLNLIDDSAKAVHEQLKKADMWMVDSTEFGEEWLKDTDGNVAEARQKIRSQFEGWTNVWARRWEFYGTKPRRVDKDRLALQFERSLWAAYLLQRVAAAWGEDEHLIDAYKFRPHQSAHASVAEEVIVERLKELNVVVAGWGQASMAQASRIVEEGAPVPTTIVRGIADTIGETADIRDWAKGYLARVRTETARDFFPPATERRPARLGV